MARSDSVGLFWEDIDTKKKGGPVRSMPKIKSEWKPLPPSEWPNYKHAKIISIDTETYDPNLKTHGAGYARGDGHIVGISAAVNKKEHVYLPMRHEVQSELNCDPDKVLLWARDNLCTKGSLKIGANLQYDLGWLRQEGVFVPGPYLDILHAEALIDETLLRYNLESISNRYLGEGKVDDKLYKWCAKYYGGKIDPDQRKNIYRAPPALVGPYASADAWLPYQIWKRQQKIIQLEGLEQVFDIECRLIPMLIEMRFAGVYVDIPYTERIRDEFYEKEVQAKEQIKKLLGFSVDVYSSASIEKAFKSENLKYPRTAKGNPSFTKAYLNAHPHKIAKVIVRVREINKLRVTFLENAILNKHVNGRLHCEYRQVKGATGGTESGRLSSANPNLQQIPARTEEGKKIRKCFIPGPDYKDWWRGDSNQIEYRFLAHDARGPGSDVMRRMYREDPNTDYHQATTVLIDKITGILLERKPTKTINFGLTYGMGKSKLRSDLGLTVKRGDKLFDAYHQGVPFVKRTFDYYMQLAQDLGYIKTILGRKSRFNAYEERFNFESTDILYDFQDAMNRWGPGGFQRAYTHKALNRRLQGSAADHLKKGMVELYESGVFDNIGSYPYLSVHDELDGPCNRNEHKEELTEVRRIMENCLTLRVPIIVDFEIGKNWGETETWKL